MTIAVHLENIISVIEAGIEADEKMDHGPRVYVGGDVYMRASDIPYMLRRISRACELREPKG